MLTGRELELGARKASWGVSAEPGVGEDVLGLVNGHTKEDTVGRDSSGSSSETSAGLCDSSLL